MFLGVKGPLRHVHPRLGSVLSNLCSHSHFDMSAYNEQLSGRLQDYPYPREEVEKAMGGLPQLWSYSPFRE